MQKGHTSNIELNVENCKIHLPFTCFSSQNSHREKVLPCFSYSYFSHFYCHFPSIFLTIITKIKFHFEWVLFQLRLVSLYVFLNRSVEYTNYELILTGRPIQCSFPFSFLRSWAHRIEEAEKQSYNTPYSYFSLVCKTLTWDIPWQNKLNMNELEKLWRKEGQKGLKDFMLGRKFQYKLEWSLKMTTALL